MGSREAFFCDFKRFGLSFGDPRGSILEAKMNLFSGSAFQADFEVKWGGAGGRGGAHLGTLARSESGSELGLNFIPSRPAPPSGGAANLKASPLPPAPCQPVTADWLTAEMGHFLYLKLSFWRP